VERYLVKKTTSSHITWRFNNKVRAMPAGKILRIETLAPSTVHWSVDDWRTAQDTQTSDTTLGVHVADLHTMNARVGDHVSLTFYWPEADRWEGTDFFVYVE
jgi:glucoamylase